MVCWQPLLRCPTSVTSLDLAEAAHGKPQRCRRQRPIPSTHFEIDFKSSLAGPLFLNFSCTGTGYTSGGKYFHSLAFKGVIQTGTYQDTA